MPRGAFLPSMNRFLYRGMLLTGTTPVMMTIRDLGAAVNYLLAQPEMKGRRLYLHGRGDGGVAALYRALIDDRIAGVILEATVGSHADGAPILGILRAMDLNHAVGLMAPRPVALVKPSHRNWTWSTRVYERLGCAERIVQAPDLRTALGKM